MTEAISSDPSKHSPTLQTIQMVERTLENYPNSVITVPELKRALPKQVNHNTLMTILEYLESSNKIYVGLKGITWIHNRNEKLRNVVQHGFRL
jgi:hypothetical protein